MEKKIVRMNVLTIQTEKGEAHSHNYVTFISEGKTYATGKPVCVHEDVEDHYYELERMIGNVEEYAHETGMKFELARIS